MAAGNFEKCLKFTLQFEGGFVNNPKDPGGPTNLGVTQATLSNFIGRQASIAEVKALTAATVAPIYKLKFWDHVGGDNLPEGVDLTYIGRPGRAMDRHNRLIGAPVDILLADRLQQPGAAKHLAHRRLEPAEGDCPATLALLIDDLRERL